MIAQLPIIANYEQDEYSYNIMDTKPNGLDLTCTMSFGIKKKYCLRCETCNKSSLFALALLFKQHFNSF